MDVRTWTAKIVAGNEIFDAAASESDLKRDQAKSAVAEVADLIEAGIVKDARVQLYKTTKAGTREDSSISVWFERNKIRTF